MNGEKNISKLNRIMTLLGVSANRLAPLCGVSGSLISRWQKGSRPLTKRSKALVPLAEALLSLDKEGCLDEILRPWQTDGESKEEALCRYMTEEDLPAMPPQAQPAPMQRSGSYVVQQQVLLGEKGFHKATLLLLDYVLRLPPGQQIIVCVHGGYNLWHTNLPFALQVLFKLNHAVKRGVTFMLINRRDEDLAASPYFSIFWLTAHLKGIIRSHYYEGEAPPEYFVGVIPGYWSGIAEMDKTAEDGVISTLHTDPRSVRKAEIHCNTYV